MFLVREHAGKTKSTRLFLENGTEIPNIIAVDIRNCSETGPYSIVLELANIELLVVKKRPPKK